MSSLILYPKGETAFDTNGLGILSDVIDDEVYEELNGQFELTVQYPMDGIHFGDIAKGNIITAHSSPVSGPQPFEIYRIKKASKGVVNIYARHIAYRNRKITVSPFSASSVSQAITGLKNNAVNACPFTFWTDKSTAGEFRTTVPKRIWSLLGNSEGSILDVYGGEYEFDKFHIKLWNRRGADRGVSIRYGKNLTSLEQDENISNTYNGVYPYWTDADGNYMELPGKIIYAEGDFDEDLIMELDCSQAFQTQPTEDELRAHTENYIRKNDIGKPEVSWTVEFVQLEQTEEYKGKALLERVLLGDTVSVVFPKLGVDVSARAVAARYKPTLDRYKNITLGKVKANIATTIVTQQQEIEKKPSTTVMQNIMSSLAASITGVRGGAVRFLDTDGDNLPDELYIADNPDPALALKVWRFNYEGWAASKTGYNGPFEFGATLSDGLLAAFVRAAHLIAGTIQSQDGETFFLDLDNGILRIKSVDKLTEDMTELKQSSEGIKISVQKLIADGVTSVKTETGYTFGANGLHIEKSGQEIANLVDHTGVYVTRSGELVFTANANGVDALNLRARQFLIVGDHGRFENYSDGEDDQLMGCFWIPGVTS